MKNLSRKAVSLLLIFAMALSLAGCNKGGILPGSTGDNNVQSIMDKDHVYKEKVVDLGEKFDEIPAIGYGEDKIYIMTSKWGDVGNEPKLFTVDKEGNVLNSLALTMPEDNGWINRYALSKDGKVYALREVYFEDYSDPENPIFESHFEVLTWDEEGAVAKQTKLEMDLGPNEYFYASSLTVAPDGKIYVGGDGRIIVLNEEADFEEQIKVEITGMSSFFFGKDNTIYFTAWDNEYTKQSLQTFDLTTKKNEVVMELGEGFSNKTFVQGGGYDFFLSDSYGLSGYNLGDAEPTLLMDYIASDIATSGIYSICSIDESSFIANYNDLANYTPVVSVFTKVNPEDVVEKELLGLAGYYIDSTVKKQVIDYNKSNDKYRIVITDYSQYSTTEDWEAGQNRMNSDIAAGNIPDILIMNSYYNDWDKYTNKGLFKDLKELMADDPAVKVEDLCENVVEALSTDGKLYVITPTYSIQTYAAKTSLVGDKKSWTFEEANELLKTLPEDTQLLQGFNRQYFLTEAMSYNLSAFVDYKTNTCKFDTPEFVHMLEMMKEYPEEIDYATYDMDENYWMEQENAYRNNKAVLMSMSIYDFRNLKRIEMGNFGEPITYIGFPTTEACGSVLNIYQGYAISAKSDKADGAWEFIKYFLTEEYQGEIEYDLPVRKSCLEKLAAVAMEKPYYEDENGEKVEYDDTYWIGNEEIIIPPMTREEVDAALEFVYSVNRKVSHNDDINNIIMEEAASYFEGQKSAEDVAKIIQSRAQLYISENS